jgi:hypothetical protein
MGKHPRTPDDIKYFDRREKRKMSKRQSKRFSFHLAHRAASEKRKRKERKTLNNSKTVVLIKDVGNSFRASLDTKKNKACCLKP